jgi:hypothetical protein
MRGKFEFTLAVESSERILRELFFEMLGLLDTPKVPAGTGKI